MNRLALIPASAVVLVTILLNFAPATDKNPFTSVVKVDADAEPDAPTDHIDELEEAVIAAVAGEIPPDSEPALVRAQVVAARTYILYCREMNFVPICGSTTIDCLSKQFLKSMPVPDETAARDAAKRSFAQIRAAAYETRGLFLSKSGEPILALWHASSAGRTESAENVFGREVDCLGSVETPEIYDNVTFEQYSDILSRSFCNSIERQGIEIERNSTGRVALLRLGNETFTGLEARQKWSLRSTDFDVKFSDGRLIFTVRGYGHGLGLSQEGARILAEGGADWREILAKYYPGSELKLLENSPC